MFGVAFKEDMVVAAATTLLNLLPETQVLTEIGKAMIPKTLGYGQAGRAETARTSPAEQRKTMGIEEATILALLFTPKKEALL
jgi:hypothetical protein